MPKNTLLAGAAKIDITPIKGTRVGVDMFSHYARFIHDPLFAKALLFRQNQTTVAIVIIDICIMPSDLMNTIKNRITIRTGITKPNILLACTHTHGAGDVAGLLGGAVDINYRNQLPERIVNAVETAIKNLKPAKIASSSSEIQGYSLCRRYFMKDEYTALNPVTKKADMVKMNPVGVAHWIKEPAGTVDPEMNFVAIKGLDGTWIAILSNYCSHYAGDWDVDTITADFYGTFAKHIGANLKVPDDFVAMMTYGTGADVNTWDFENPNRFPKTEFAKTEMMGKDLAQGILDKIETLEWDESPHLQIAYEELQLRTRKPKKEEVQAAEKLLANHRFENLELNDHGLAMVYAREQIFLSEFPDFHTAAVQAINIGSQILGALGGEIFTETGLWLKKQIPNVNYFTICLANSYDGYVPPKKELERGGYETWRARSSFLDDEAESTLKFKMVNLVKQFSQE